MTGSRQPFSSETLTLSGRDFFRRALSAYAADDDQVVVTFAVIGLEHLLKALLMTANPLFIADARDFKSLAILDDASRFPRNRVKTVGAREALDRVSALHPGLSHAGPDLNAALEVRNGVVHSGMADRSDVRKQLAACLLQAQEVLRVLGQAQSSFWDPHEDLMRSTVTEARQGDSHDIAKRIAAARHRYDRRLEALGDVPDVLDFMEEEPSNDTDYERARECPACERYGLAFGQSEVLWDDYHFGDGQVETWGNRYFYPSTFRCKPCGLELFGERELEAAGIPREWLTDDNVEPDLEPE